LLSKLDKTKGGKIVDKKKKSSTTTRYKRGFPIFPKNDPFESKEVKLDECSKERLEQIRHEEVKNGWSLWREDEIDNYFEHGKAIFCRPRTWEKEKEIDREISNALKDSTMELKNRKATSLRKQIKEDQEEIAKIMDRIGSAKKKLQTITKKCEHDWKYTHYDINRFPVQTCKICGQTRIVLFSGPEDTYIYFE